MRPIAEECFLILVEQLEGLAADKESIGKEIGPVSARIQKFLDFPVQADRSFFSGVFYRTKNGIIELSTLELK
jgi:hypothetical protein